MTDRRESRRRMRIISERNKDRQNFIQNKINFFPALAISQDCKCGRMGELVGRAHDSKCPDFCHCKIVNGKAELCCFHEEPELFQGDGLLATSPTSFGKIMSDPLPVNTPFVSDPLYVQDYKEFLTFSVYPKK